MSNFINNQQVIRDLIASHSRFSCEADNTVFVDLGHVKSQLENALESFGYSVSVWPASKVTTVPNDSGTLPMDSTNVVRLQISPQKLAALSIAHQSDDSKPDAGPWTNRLITSIIQAVLSLPPTPGGVKFSMPVNALELVNFDDGLLAFHIRFDRFSVFGENDFSGYDNLGLFLGSQWRWDNSRGWQKWDKSTAKWYSLLSANNPPEIDWDSGLSAVAPAPIPDDYIQYFPGTKWRFRTGKGWQIYNGDTSLWYTLINKPPLGEMDYDAGEPGPAPQ